MALPASDSFTASAGPLADPPWTTPSADKPVYTGSGECEVGGAGSDEIAVWNSDSFGPDQYAECSVKIATPPVNYCGINLVVRSDGADFSTGTCYLTTWAGGTQYEIYKLVSGSFTRLDQQFHTAAVDGDVLRLDVVGSVLTYTVNGVQVATAVDSDIASGQPGFDLTSDDGPGFLQITSWTADASSAPPPPGTHVVTGRGVESISSPAWLSTSISGRPAHLGNGPAEPVNYLHMGSLSWGSSNGVMNRYIVTRDLDLVNVPDGMTELHYEFADGITATIVELATP
jgi:hypothetical protein